MDFVLRDAYMSGYSTRAFDIARLLHYSMFTDRGLTIHERGLSALVQFISVRAELFRAIYFHRTVRAIDLELQEVFRDSKRHLFPGDPPNISTEYRRFTEWSLLMEVSRWPESGDPELRELGRRWRRVVWPPPALEDGLRADGVLRPRRSGAGQRAEQRRRRSRRPCGPNCRRR